VTDLSSAVVPPGPKPPIAYANDTIIPLLQEESSWKILLDILNIYL